MINIEEHFSFHKGDCIVVGCSTGPDSMALVDMLLKIRKQYDLSLVIAHVNHNVRKESFEEESFLQKYCLENNLFFETMLIEKYGDDNFHNEARTIRYQFFESVVRKYSANYLFTAHHGDDLMETILMRIVRGSNLSGYGGFKEVVELDGYKIVRPLLRYTKQELEEYDQQNHVTYFVDSSNQKDIYTRNRYRKYILPFFKEENPLVHLKFLKYSESLNEAAKYIEKQRKSAIKRVMSDQKIQISAFLEEDDYLQKEILYSLLEEYYQDDLILVGDAHIHLLLELIHSSKANAFVNLPNEVIAVKEYHQFFLKKEIQMISSYEIEFDEYVTLPNGHIIKKVLEEKTNGNDVCRLNSSDITLPLTVRTRRVGDKIKIKGLNGSKKIKDVFINSKIPTKQRESWPIVVDARGEVVWIPGVKKSKFDKKKTDRYDIILKYS